MKRILVLGMLLSTVGVVNLSHAESTSEQVKKSPAKEVVEDCPINLQENKDIYQQLEGMMKEVGLTDSQKKEIDGIIRAEKGRVVLIQKDAGENWNELMRVAFSAQNNQTRYNQLVQKLDDLSKKVIAEHAQMMRDINGKLTVEQRDKLLKLIPKKLRRSRSSGFGFGFGFGF